MSVTTSSYLIGIDGFIYNQKDLGITKAGVEGIIVLYEKFGFENLLCRLNGDFTIILYDSKLNTLWIARDRFGVKPLYYAQTTEGFAFSSRPRSLLSLPGVSKELNRRFVTLFAGSHYRTFDNRPEESPYANVFQLPPAHFMKISQGGISISKYWSLQDFPDFTEAESVLASRYRELLLDSVSLRLKVAKSPAFTLSGGMDSSSVLASAVHLSREKQHAFSTVYDDKTYDESAEIQSMLERTVQQWHPVRLGNPDIFSLVEQMVEIHQEPVATATWLSHFLLCQEAKKQGFQSLFGGLGGDELNAGEFEYFFFLFADLRISGEEELLELETEKWIEHHNHPIFRKSISIREDGLVRLIDPSRPGRCLPNRQRLERYQSTLNPDYFDGDFSLSTYEPIMEHRFRSYLKNRTYQDLSRETIPCCLRAEDRQSSYLGLENFLPFFDHRLVEFMFRIPASLKIRRGVTKYLLREAMRGILPEETRTRIKKTGWNAPAHIWFVGRGKETLLDLVHSQSFRERGVYNVKEVIRVIQEHDDIVTSHRTQDNHMMFLWQLINLELWLRWLDGLP